MRKKYLHSLTVLYVLTLTGLLACRRSQPLMTSAPETDKNTLSEIPVCIDTIDITDKNYRYLKKHSAGGLYDTHRRAIVLFYFRALSNKAYIMRFCEFNNALYPLNLRHEKEHARKHNLVHGRVKYSALGNARLAAVNEIVAPAAEIIEFIDHHARTGEYLPKKLFLMRADSAISTIPFAKTENGVDFNYCPVADAVLTYALQGFLDAVNRGYYTGTIRAAYNQKTRKTSVNAGIKIPVPFNPDLNAWDPMWELESDAGPCNPYRYASWHVRSGLIRAVDSVIYSNTNAGKIATFHKSAILR